MDSFAVPLRAVGADPPADRANARAGYADVFTAHNDAMLRLAFLMTGDRDRSEEAVAEAFAKVWPHWRRGRVADDAAYLRRAVVNEVHSLGRRRGRDDRLVARTKVTAPLPWIDDHATDREAVLAALAALPSRQRAVIVLRFYEDLTEADTAVALGMRIGTVKSQTSRGLQKLRGLLTEEER